MSYRTISKRNLAFLAAVLLCLGLLLPAFQTSPRQIGQWLSRGKALLASQDGQLDSANWYFEQAIEGMAKRNEPMEILDAYWWWSWYILNNKDLRQNTKLHQAQLTRMYEMAQRHAPADALYMDAVARMIYNFNQVTVFDSTQKYWAFLRDNAPKTASYQPIMALGYLYHCIQANYESRWTDLRLYTDSLQQIVEPIYLEYRLRRVLPVAFWKEVLQQYLMVMGRNANDLSADYDKAIEYAQAAIEFTADVAPWDSVSMIINRRSLAEAYFNKRDYAKGLEVLAQTHAWISNNDFERASLFNVEGIYRYKSGDYAQAIEKEKQALAFAAKLPKEHNWFQEKQDMYLHLIAAYAQTGRLDSAERYLPLVGDYRQNSTARPLLAKYYLAKKDLGQARRLLDEQLSLNKEKEYKNRFVPEIYLDLSQTGRNAPESLAYLQKALMACSDTFQQENPLAFPPLADLIYWDLALEVLLRKLDAIKEAYPAAVYREVLLSQVPVLSELLDLLWMGMEQQASKQNLLKVANNHFAQALLALGQQNQPTTKQAEAALRWMEQYQSRFLQEALQSSTPDSMPGLPKAFLAAYQQANREQAFYAQALLRVRSLRDSAKIGLYERYLRRAESLRDSLNRELQANYVAYWQLGRNPQRLTLADLQAQLSDSMALLFWWDAAGVRACLQVEKQQYRYWAKPVPNGDSSLVNLLRGLKSGAQDSSAVWWTASQALYQQLFPTGLPTHLRELMIVPQGSLAYLPFEVLVTGAKPREDSLGLPYELLLQQVAIQYHFSAQLWLDQLKDKDWSPVNAQLFALAAEYRGASSQVSKADTDSSSSYAALLHRTLLPLPSAKEEVKALAEIYKGYFCLEEEANEAIFKQWAGEYGILHLAMHGVVNQQKPQLSNLVFSQVANNKEDDVLYSDEIRALPLKAGLVVLSACETGLGQYQPGEGLVSLGRSFLYAGARSVLLSLWAVNDASTKQLILQYYQGLAQGLDKHQALRQAKLQYLASHKGLPSQHPSYWAAFVQQGDIRPLPPRAPINKIWWYLLPLLGVGLLGWWTLNSLKR
jgi:CHAT domain-containing protein